MNRNDIFFVILLAVVVIEMLLFICGVSVDLKVLLAINTVLLIADCFFSV